MKRRLLCFAMAIYLLWLGYAFPAFAAEPYMGVTETAFCYAAVKWAVENNITNGYSDGLFHPERTCTKRSALTFLWRAYEKTEESADGDDMEEAIRWAERMGFEPDGFDASAPCSRGDFVRYLYLYQRSKNPESVADIDKSDVNSLFWDVFPTDDYAAAVVWANKTEITKGYDDASFRPLDYCTRGHIVTFLYRYNGLS